MSQKPSVYLDYAATTPVDQRVIKAMQPYLTEKFGNASSLHRWGQAAAEALEESRKNIADFLGAKPEEIIFTASASESNNLALKGIAWANQDKGRHLVISAIEHDCVFEAANWLGSQGWEVTQLPVDKWGLIDPATVAAALRPETVLVSVMHANNEIGVIEPIAKIGAICREKGVYLHVDAAQTVGKIPVKVNDLQVDLLTASAHKLYGPKGVALLYLREGVKITPLLHGGGHEGGRRSSTSNVIGVVGFAAAVKIAEKEMAAETARIKALRAKLVKGVLETISGSYLNGHPEKTLPQIVSFRFDRLEGEALLMRLDAAGIGASTGSACSSPKLTPSRVLTALGIKPQEAHGSLRLSLGRLTTEAEVDYLLQVLPKVVADLRKLSPFKSS